jgi:hypothetical protein
MSAHALTPTTGGAVGQPGASTLSADVAGQILQFAPQPQGIGDPAVENCFVLGWHMAELRSLRPDVQG